MNGRLSVHVCTYNRVGEFGMLLSSLRFQTFKDWDLVIIDQSETPSKNYKQISDILTRLKLDGHGVKYVIDQLRKGISATRNKAVMEDPWKNEYIVRLDDDSFCEIDYLERLMKIVTKGCDDYVETGECEHERKEGECKFSMMGFVEKIGAVGGIVPLLGSPNIIRDTRFLKNNFDEIIYNDGRITVTDNGGYSWLPNKVLLSHHLRSCFLFRRSAWEKVNGFSEDMGGSISGFREETDFSIKLAQAGYFLLLDTGAKAYHMPAMTGGARGTNQEEYRNALAINEEHFQRKFKYLFNKFGNPYLKWEK